VRFARRKLGWIERVKVECSEVTRGADAARPFALLLCCNRPAHGVGEPRAELRFDPGALSAEAICPKFGNHVADAADLFVDRSPIEEAQTCCGHRGPSWQRVWRKYRERRRRETQSSIRMPSISDQWNQPVVAPALSVGDRLARPTSQLDAVSSFRNPWPCWSGISRAPKARLWAQHWRCWFHLGGCLGANFLVDAVLEIGPSIRAAIGLIPSVSIGVDADQLHIRRNPPVGPTLLVRHPHGILPPGVLRGGASHD
jgi:hypothetical protein